MNLKRFLKKLGDAKLSDYLSIFLMLIGFFLSPFYKKKYRDEWAICERKDEARDNGYHFFRFMIHEHPEQPCLYVIDKKCNDYKKVKEYGTIIQFGSISHWITYFTCKYLISSQGFMPNGYICAFIERAGLFKPSHVFLQHGITINKPEYLLPEMMRLKYFITATPQETKFVSEEIGHGVEITKLCGFSRFDALHDNKPVNGRILVMPTWRKWLRFKSERHEDAKGDLLTSDYIIMWKKLMSDLKLEKLIEKYNLEVIFIPHPNMKDLINPQIMVGDRIEIKNNEEIQELMMSSQLLITDYSSVFFDMVYMKKPVIFYQFDEDKFRKYHYPQGWFNYKSTRFGRACKNPDEVISELSNIVERNYLVDSDFLSEHQEVFPLYDNNNSRRIYELLSRNEAVN